MENKNFRKMIALIDSHPQYYSTLAQIEEEYMVKIYKIGDLNSNSVTDLYNNMQKKFYFHRKNQNEEFWYQNQLRIFIWLLFGYLYVHQKSITDLNENDWNFFSSIFNCKSTVFFEFQTLSVIKNKQRPPSWSQQETAILQQIMSQTKFQNRWNSIARELFIKSGRRFFRNPKQCRERWMNHLDPSKIRTSWTPNEDLILLNTIKKRGKKWSLAVKELSNTRTEHMVKNRYKSLISNQAKKYPQKRQAELQNILIKRISKTQQKSYKNTQVKVEQRESDPHNGEVKAKQQNSEVMQEIVQEQQIKVEQEQNIRHHIEDRNSNQQLQARSPIYLPWRTQSLQNYTINLLEDDRADLQNNNFYEFQSQESFLF